MLRNDYRYKAKVVNIHDGDTMTLDVDLGFYITVRMLCRLHGLNARELSEVGGPEARLTLEALCPYGSDVEVQSITVDKYAGRFDAIVLNTLGLDVNEIMIEDGYAIPWDGKGKKPVPPWPIVKVTP